ncbi:MAG: hypothetical protein EBS18_06540, partial [Actinobacteria bacterium]|nr:hypothetical protein [Actinomycetota bacterium]
MTAWTPDWKLTVGGVDYTDIAISDIQHQAGRDDIYTQPSPSYVQITLVALNGQTLPFDINDSLDLQVKDSSAAYVSIFGGDITDITVAVGATGSIGTVIEYTLIAMGSLVKLAKEIWDDNIPQDEDGNQIYDILSSVLLGTWNDVPAATQWSTYDATETWANALNLGLGEIDQPGLYTMQHQPNTTDTIYNIVSDIANSAFGYIYEDNVGNIGYADADHRQNYLLTNGYVELDANQALGAGLSTVMRSADVRNDIYINYGNNYGSQKTASDAASIALYGYKAETINSRIHGAVDAQAIADRYIAQRAYPKPSFQSITFPITNPEIDNADRDDLLGVFIGMPVNIKN